MKARRIRHRGPLGGLASLIALVTAYTTGCFGSGEDAAGQGAPVDASSPDGFALAEPTPTDGGADGANGADAGESFAWNLPPGFPLPVVPADNPMSAAKVALGRRLFYDTRLSHNQTQSCASCHHQALAFADARAQGLGSTGSVHPRGPMSLANVAYAATLTWANPLQLELERQALVPMFGDDPIELGLTSTSEIVDRLAAVDLYPPLFAAAYPGDPAPITLDHIVKALASFERTLISGRSPFDRWLRGTDDSAISDAAKRGYGLFNGEKFECFHCHVGFDLTDHVTYAGKPFVEKPFHNTGLYNIDGMGAYPAPNTGAEHVTHVPTDMGRFKAPTLRNIAITAPYMHDGSIASLEEVLDHYVAGGRTITTGPNAGNGSTNPFKDPLIRPLDVTPQERADLIEYLRSLTDDSFLNDPSLSDPW